MPAELPGSLNPISERKMEDPITKTDLYMKALEARDFIMSRFGDSVKAPHIGVICGSGLGGLADALENTVSLPYGDIPGFVLSTVPGHAGKLVVGTLSGKSVVCMVGRLHFYEGYSFSEVTFPVRVMQLLGVEVLIVTNASGALNPQFKVGDVMLIDDHINLLGLIGNNPLRGPNEHNFGTRFPAMSDAYDDALRKIASECACEIGWGTSFVRGNYCYISGPMYETMAEARMLRLMGADAVGMSTVPEVLVARHCHMKVLGLALVTNVVVMNRDESIPITTHAAVVAASQFRAQEMQRLVSLIVSRIDLSFGKLQ